MKKLITSSCLILIILFISCTSTKITSSWREPEKHLHSGEWKKILVVSLLKNETNRRKVEDEMVKHLKGKGVASYTYLDDNFNKQNEEELKKKIKADGFDGAITMRLIDVDKEKVYIPEERNLYPNYYNNFSQYYNRSLHYYSTPEYYVVTKTFIIETIVYSIEEDKIIWSGITETFNPNGIKYTTKEIAKVIYKKMIDEGFIQKN
ncbi:MAG: hypothetical protein ABI549_10800 [Flavobacterium sp.]|uniref:hypothetical protein n=1 Tax=Flavobacterium sp. TaxID=239 RepID=UPI0032644D07